MVTMFVKDFIQIHYKVKPSLAGLPVTQSGNEKQTCLNSW